MEWGGAMEWRIFTAECFGDDIQEQVQVRHWRIDQMSQALRPPKTKR